MTKPSGSELRLTIQMSDPPAGVTFAVQVGKSGLVGPSRSLPDRLEFDVVVTVTPRSGDAAPRLLGPVAQGPASGRFIYINCGQYAGDAGSPWARRTKIHLGGIDWPLVEAAQATPMGRLVVRYAGKDRKDEPACASVALLDGGWRLDRGAAG